MKKYISVLLCLILLLTAIPVTVSAGAFSGEDKINIVLDPGHGGSNVGAAARGVGEKTYTYQLATLIKEKLEANGSFNVYFTRTGDYDLELYERAVVANRYNADILISLHFDGNADPGVRGVTTYTSVIDSYAATTLSSSIAQSISSATGFVNNGVRRRTDTAGYYWSFEKQWDCQDPSLGTLSDYYGIPTWCAKFGIPSIIVEHGYLSNSGDVAIICAEGGIEKIAEAEAQAIIGYYTDHTHTYSAARRDFPSNCVFTGKQSEHCSVCGHRRNVTLLAEDLSNHYWITKESTPASCGVDGKVYSECRISANLRAKGWEGDLHTSTVIIPALEAGKIVLCDIGFPKELAENLPKHALIPDDEYLKEVIPKRHSNSHKGSYGKLLLFCASPSMTGAGYLSCMGALRSGCGLVNIASDDYTISLLQQKLNEPIFSRVDISSSNGLDNLVQLADSSSAVLCGCGLGNNENTKKAVFRLIKNVDSPLLLDADGINVLCENINILKEAKHTPIITPHPAEFARLIGKTTDEVQSDRINLAVNFAKEYGCITVLKGASTVIASPDGRFAVNIAGNAGLAKGGSGDVLAGICAGLLCQCINAFDAAVAGVYLHAKAADILKERIGEYGLLPSDIPLEAAKLLP